GHRGRRILQPRKLRVGVREAGARVPAFVEERVGVAVRNRLAPPPPRLGDEIDLVLLELGEGAHVPRRVDDDLLPLEGAVEVRDDAYGPVPALWQAQRLRRRSLLVAGAEGALLELLRRRRGYRPARCAGPPSTC